MRSLVQVPLRLQVLQGELTSSWIMRLAHKNGLMVASLLAEVGFGRQIQTDLDLHAPSELIHNLAMAGLYAGDQDRLTRAMIANWGEKTGTLFQCMRRWILPAGHRHSRIRYCPLCLVDNPFYRKTWRLNWYAACHRHKVMLWDHCHACQAPQVLYRSSWKHQIGCCTNCHNPLSKAEELTAFDEVNYWHTVAVSLNKLRLGNSQKATSPWFQATWTLAKFLEKLRNDDKSVNLYLSEPLNTLRDTFPLAVAFHQARILWDEEPFALQKLLSEFQFEFDRITYHSCPRALKPYRRSKDWRIPTIEELESAIHEIKQLGEQVTYFRIAEVAGCSFETIRKYEHLDSFVKKNVCYASFRRLRS